MVVVFVIIINFYYICYKININVQLNRELIDKIKEQNISLKEYIEKLLKNKL
jgi:cell division protein FtsL